MLRRHGDMKGKVAHYAETAGAVGPIVRRLASDEQVRDDAKVVVDAARKLYADLSGDEPFKATRRILTDSDMHQRVQRLIAALEQAGGSAHYPQTQKRSRVGWLVAGGILAALAYSIAPRTRSAARRRTSKTTETGTSGAPGSGASGSAA